MLCTDNFTKQLMRIHSTEIEILYNYRPSPLVHYLSLNLPSLSKKKEQVKNIRGNELNCLNNQDETEGRISCTSKQLRSIFVSNAFSQTQPNLKVWDQNKNWIVL